MTKLFHCTALIIALSLSVTAFAEEEAKKEAKPAEAKQPTIDDLLDIDTPDKPKPDDKDEPKVNPDIEDELSLTEAADAFEKAVVEMAQAADLLEKQKEAGLPTQRVQQSILAKLDQVIAAAKKNECKSCSSGSPKQSQKQDTGSKKNEPKQGQKQAQKPGQKQGQKPGQPKSQGSKPNQGQVSPGSVAGVEEKGPLAELRAEWGNLPPRLRDELIQGLREKISPIYRTMTEEYYRLLAEESGNN